MDMTEQQKAEWLAMYEAAVAKANAPGIFGPVECPSENPFTVLAYAAFSEAKRDVVINAACEAMHDDDLLAYLTSRGYLTEVATDMPTLVYQWIEGALYLDPDLRRELMWEDMAGWRQEQLELEDASDDSDDTEEVPF